MSFQDDESSDASDSEADDTLDTNSNNKENNKVQNGKQSYKNGTNGKNDQNKDNVKEERRSSLISMWFGSYLANHPLLKSIDGRAASVHNFMRGLSLYKAYPFSPFTSIEDQKLMEDRLTGSDKYVEPFPQKKPWFLRVCCTCLLKTLWKRRNCSSRVISPFPIIFP